MKYKIEELKDITDSREIINSIPNGFSKYMMYIIISLLSLTLVWSLLAKKEISINATGTLKPSEEIYKITSATNGNITYVNLKEGREVKKGDSLIVVNGDEYEIQQSILQENLSKKEKELAAVKKLKDSVNDGKNYLSAEDEIEGNFYKKYELYNSTMSEYSKEGSSSETQLNNIKGKINDLNLLLKGIEEEVNYFSADHYMYYQYVEYEMALAEYRKTIERYNEKIAKLETSKVNNVEIVEKEDEDGNHIENNTEVSNELIDDEIETLKESILSTEKEIEKYKNSQKSAITSSIAQNEESLRGSTIINSSNTYKTQFLSELATSISALEESISEIEMNLKLTNSKIEATTIKAEYDGVINIINEVNIGDYIQSGTVIANIVPNENLSYSAEIYIPNASFGEISEGQEVNLEFAALPQSEYGIIKTTINNISVDAKVSESQGTSYYTAVCDIKNTSVKNKKGESISLKSGMLVEAKLINREVSYFRYFMELINILN